MTNLFFVNVTFSGGLRKVEAALQESIYRTYNNAIVTAGALPTIVENFKNAVKVKAAELKGKEVEVALSPEYNEATPRFLSVGRITLVLHPVSEVIGTITPKGDA